MSASAAAYLNTLTPERRISEELLQLTLQAPEPLPDWFVTYAAGMNAFSSTGKTPSNAYLIMRQLYAITRGQVDHMVTQGLGRLLPIPPLPDTIVMQPPFEGVGDQTAASIVAQALDDLRANGFHQFGFRLSQTAVNRLANILDEKPLNASSGNVYAERSSIAADDQSPRYMSSEPDIISDAAAAEVSLHPIFSHVADAYLGSLATHAQTCLWMSVPRAENMLSLDQAAQLYHFDKDYTRFLKFFVYLCDVGTANGPHMYVKGSHTTKTPATWRDGRISDAEMEAEYPGACLELHGTAGTVLAVDTLGFHKGKSLQEGFRKILQVTYTNSLFGAEFETLDPSILPTSALRARVEADPRRFGRFFVGR